MWGTGVLTAALAALALTASASASPAPDGRIVNPDSDSRAIPFQAAVVTGPNFTPRDVFCGATVVDALHVVMAGHCFAGDVNAISPTQIQVIAGITNLDAPEATRQQRTVARIARHPNYYVDSVGQDKHFDAVVLTLVDPLSLGGAVEALPLVAAGSDDHGRQALVSGWGDTDGSAPYGTSATLQHATIDVLADSRCQGGYTSYDASHMICALHDSPTRDSCVGDSGGPLARLTGPGAGTPDALIGIVSYGAMCADTTHPGVYTRVSAPVIHDFLVSALTPRAGAPSLSGSARVGDTLACATGAWEGATAFAYQWLRDGQPIAAATGAEYVPTAEDQAHSLACRVTGSNGALTVSADSAGTPAVAPAPAPIVNPVALAKDTFAPTSRITKGKCTRKLCRLSISVKDTGGATAPLILRFTLQRLTGCPKGAGGRRCRSPRPLTAQRVSRGSFRVTLRNLAIARYRATAVATDGAGNRQRRATVLSFRVKHG